MKKIRHALHILFPSNGTEVLLFLLLLTVYGILGSYIAWHFRLIYDDRIPWDAYFSFDNRSIVVTGGGFERHPFSNYFFSGIQNLALWISEGKTNEIFRLVLAWCSNLAVSLGIVQIYKYFRNVIGLPIGIGLLITAFFSFFVTPLLLSFTPETYTYTFLLLTSFNYYAALKLKEGQKIPAVSLVLAALGIGGLTITNIVKVYIPILFEKKIFWNFKKIGNAIFRVLLSAAVFVLLFLYRLNWDYMRIFAKTEEQYEKFSNPKVTPIWDMIASWFMGGNMLFSSFIVKDYHNLKGYQYKALFMAVYSSAVPYVFVAAVLLLVLWSYVKNIRNSLVHILMISFLVDLVIHCVLKFGLHTSYIYGGHFIFVFPLMLGWLFHGYRKSPKTLTFLTIITGLLLIYLVVNNVYRMAEFFEFMEKYYR